MKMTDNQINSFHDRGYNEIVIPEGTKMWRFVSKQADRNNLGAFWIDDYTMTTLMRVFHAHGDFSQGFKKEVIRDNLAIIKEWSHLSWRQQIVLNKPTVAYKGLIGRQLDALVYENCPLILGRQMTNYLQKMRAGGYMQYVIPHFPALKGKEKDEWVKFEHFAHI